MTSDVEEHSALERAGVRPLCFVLMPFRDKPDPAGGPNIDFDAIWTSAIEPGIHDARMEPIRGDLEASGGIIQKPMFERLLLCDFAIADLTTGNPNVFYELGIRHTALPATTLPIIAAKHRIPFDITVVSALQYELTAENTLTPELAADLRSMVTRRLLELRNLAVRTPTIDSPLFELITDWRPPRLSREKTDVFWDLVRYSERTKRELADIRVLGRRDDGRDDATRQLAGLRQQIDIDAAETGVHIDLLLTYRALEQWDEMIEFHDELPEITRRQVLVQEQLAFALNRRAEATGREASLRRVDRAKAIRVLEAVLERQGPSAETLGLLGRAYKSSWTESTGATRQIYLDRAIDAYVRGFRVDLRDAYPGINAATLLDVKGDEASRTLKDEIVPVVRFAVRQRLLSTTPDYWDHATMLELAVLVDDVTEAREQLALALAMDNESWMLKTTANNLTIIADARHLRGVDEAWSRELIDELVSAAEAPLDAGP